jgi:hypothetical protein
VVNVSEGQGVRFCAVVLDFAGFARLSLALVQSRGVDFPRHVGSPVVKV